MAEATPKKVFKPRFNKKDVIITGQVKFSNLKEAKGFQGSQDDKKYEIVITMSPDDPQLEVLRSIHKEAVDFELSGVVASKRGSLIVAPLSVEVDMDKDGKETGLVRIKAKRKENKGRPGLYDAQTIQLDRDFVRSGSDVKVQVTVMSYVMGKTVGSSLRLENVQIVREEAMSGDYVAKPAEMTFTPLEGDSLGNPFDVM